MKLYTSDNKEHDFVNLNNIGSGYFANVYLLPDGKCLKKFNKPVGRGSTVSFDETVFNIIKQLDLIFINYMIYIIMRV